MTLAEILPAAAANVGIAVVLITSLGYLSNYLNWRFLDYRITRLLYYLGTFVHELSHAVLCVLTGARITEFKVFTDKPYVRSERPRLPVIGQLLISIAPIFGGLALLFVLDAFFLQGRIILPTLSSWQGILDGMWALVSQADIGRWQGWLLILIFVNAGEMIGPSLQDLKNSWPAIIVLFFVQSPLLAQLGLLAVCLIIINIAIQAAAILAIWAVRRLIYR